MRVWNQHAAMVIESMEEGMMLRLVWELRVAWEVVWAAAAAKKMGGGATRSTICRIPVQAGQGQTLVKKEPCVPT